MIERHEEQVNHIPGNVTEALLLRVLYLLLPPRFFFFFRSSFCSRSKALCKCTYAVCGVWTLVSPSPPLPLPPRARAVLLSSQYVL